MEEKEGEGTNSKINQDRRREEEIMKNSDQDCVVLVIWKSGLTIYPNPRFKNIGSM